MIHSSWARISRGLRAFGMMIGFGVTLSILLGAAIAARVAPEATHRAAVTLTTRPGWTVVSSLVLWLAAPGFALFIAASVVGLPIGLGFWLIILPALGFLGFIISGVALGEAVLRRSALGEARPYLSALAGTGLLLALSLLPVIGPVVSVLAATLGGGAIVLTAFWHPGLPSDAAPGRKERPVRRTRGVAAEPDVITTP